MQYGDAILFSLQPSHLHFKFFAMDIHSGGPGRVVGIATAYDMDGPGIESRWGEIFHTYPDWP
jgi:hypothetical protein